jgi:hypothetical protein
MRSIAASREGGASVFDAEEALFARGGILEGMADVFWGSAYYWLRGPDAGKMAKAAEAAGLEVMETLPSCERIDVEVEFPAASAREAEDALKAWLAEERIDFVESRQAASRRLTPAARDMKKRVLIEAELLGPESSASGGFLAILALGPKASLVAWLSRMDYAAARSASVQMIGYLK